MSIEINRLIRQLQQVAEANSGVDLFVKVHNEAGDLVDPDKDSFEYGNDYQDRMVILNGA